ncbi:MAG: hypothetical protein ACI33S_06385 [Bacilli bacterium]
MAKNSMKMKYKPVKRERNKKSYEKNTEQEVKSFAFTLLGVLVFMGLIYLCVLGMEKLGVFEMGYTKPEKGEVTFDYEYITMGTVLNRSEKTYYVLFDNYKNSITEDTYVNSLITKQDKYRVYKVNMNENENKKYISEDANLDIKTINDIRINDITLIKVTNGKIVDYAIGSDDIEEYLK